MAAIIIIYYTRIRETVLEVGTSPSVAAATVHFMYVRTYEEYIRLVSARALLVNCQIRGREYYYYYYYPYIVVFFPFSHFSICYPSILLAKNGGGDRGRRKEEKGKTHTHTHILEWLS